MKRRINDNNNYNRGCGDNKQISTKLIKEKLS